MKISSFLLFIFLFSSVSFAEDPIGIAVPLSGDGAWLGENVVKGVKFYFKEKNLDFSEKTKLEDLAYNQAMTSTGIIGVKKLIDVDKVVALILCNSAVVNAVAPYIDEKGVPTISIVGAETATGRSHQVRLWPRPQDEAEALANSLRGKSLAIIYSEQDAQIARKKALESALVDTKIVFSSVADNESMSTVVMKAIKTKPDSVNLLVMPGLNGLAAKKFRQYKYAGTFNGTIAIDSKNEKQIAEGSLNGALYPDAALSEEFLARYTKEFNEYPGPGVAPGYDAAKMIFEGLKESGSDKEKFNEMIHRDNFSGAMGTYGILKDGSNSYKVPVALRTVK